MAKITETTDELLRSRAGDQGRFPRVAWPTVAGDGPTLTGESRDVPESQSAEEDDTPTDRGKREETPGVKQSVPFRVLSSPVSELLIVVRRLDTAGATPNGRRRDGRDGGRKGEAEEEGKRRLIIA